MTAVEIAGRPAMSKIKLLILAAIGFLAALALWIINPFGNLFDPLDAGRNSVSGQHVGQTKQAIVARFGPPSNQWEGHYGNPDDRYCKANNPAITFIYERPSGILYLSFKQVNGAWVCFTSDWMPNGCVF